MESAHACGRSQVAIEIHIIFIAAVNFVYTPFNLREVPFVAITVYFYDVTFGGPTPSVEVTPRQCRLPTRSTWLGRVWLTLTAQPRRVYYLSTYRYIVDTPCKW